MGERVAIIGCGLIGASFASALRAAGRAGTLIGFDRHAPTALRARELGLVDVVARSIEDVVLEADLIVVAVPVGQMREVFGAIAGALPANAVVVDVGSTKRDVIAAARAALGAAISRFVPCHPIAGREVHGPDAADADLFRGRRVLLTPLPENPPATVERVAAAWTACGARVETLDAALHDTILSSVSHLPHVLAFALVAQIADMTDADVRFGLAGSGFRDFTRIAASSPEMWRDIALANREALLADLDAYRARLDALRDRLDESDGDALLQLFGKASSARLAWRDQS